jgi:hypothetical protein
MFIRCDPRQRLGGRSRRLARYGRHGSRSQDGYRRKGEVTVVLLVERFHEMVSRAFERRLNLLVSNARPPNDVDRPVE